MIIMNNSNSTSGKKRVEIAIPIPEQSDAALAKDYLDSIPDYDDNFTIEMIIQKY